MARPARRRGGRGMAFPETERPSPPVTNETRLLSISVQAAAAADCSSKIEALGVDGNPHTLGRLSAQRDQHLHEIHCLAVELGLADRQPARYGVHHVPLSTSGSVPVLRREPRP